MHAPLPHMWLGIDPHDSPMPNANYLVIGKRCTATMLGVAVVMGLCNVVVMPDYPFFDRFPNFVSVETERAPGVNPLSSPPFWRECIERMVCLGPEGMRRLGEQEREGLNYYVKMELMRVDEHGEPSQGAIDDISRLEGTSPPGPYFAPFGELHPLFNVKPSLRPFQSRLCVGYWDDVNHSPQRPDLGLRPDGHLRRAAFGALLLKINPPVVEVV